MMEHEAGLIEGLKKLGDEYGPLGVALAAGTLTDRGVLIRALMQEQELEQAKPWPEGPNPHAAPRIAGKDVIPQDDPLPRVAGRPVPRVAPPIELPTTVNDPVNHPKHYTAYKGLEIIDLTEQMNFNRGNAVKYIARAGLKDGATEIQDLEKASWYIRREIERLRGE